MESGQRQFRTAVHYHYQHRRTEFSRARQLSEGGFDISCMPRTHEPHPIVSLKFREARADKHIAAKIAQTMTSLCLSRQPAQMAELLMGSARRNLDVHDEPAANSRIAALLISSIADKASEAIKASPPDIERLRAYQKLARALAGRITVIGDATELLETKGPQQKADELLYVIKHPVALGIPKALVGGILDDPRRDGKQGAFALNQNIAQALAVRAKGAGSVL